MTWSRLVLLLAPERGRAALAVSLQVATVAAGVALMGTSAWLLSKAALHPSVAALSVAVVGVRAFGIARAFLKDAPVLVLDEPTAQLDPESEAAVVDAIEELRKGRTVLLVAHRLTTVTRADRIALVARGRVVEEGTHRQLGGAGRGYAQLLAAWQGAP